MDYFQYKVRTRSELVEILIAFFSELPFDTFETETHGFNAYISVDQDREELKRSLNELNKRFPFTFQKERIKDQNWNRIWESNFKPIIVGDFCGIRADFHLPLEKVKHEIIINPKMAFGTGHHETTFMVMEVMEKLDFSGKKVLDYGCGTGILAILAGKLGAREIQAVDIEFPSYENTIENALANGVQAIKTIHGTLENIKENSFEIILANINRNVILDSLPTLYRKLEKNGKLIVSGFIKKDKHILIEKAEKPGFSVKETKQKSNWICMILEK